ncbi:uncharacterized protein LY89DRAFT_733600 [Mollisia scopiformis]|uniref:Uncharacterized protein n=1 Tax=Mollisia scopiformis TaxID=149040 RepID=A0A194XC79_MOLSC|nr:uncharacterized protein LY89DRAFT_733600 [Mollisia scopiformis]KUJ17778.1 hypothetical protein LY89DRAFT_733600 [Mollisia scopiformis]
MSEETREGKKSEEELVSGAMIRKRKGEEEDKEYDYCVTQVPLRLASINDDLFRNDTHFSYSEKGPLAFMGNYRPKTDAMKVDAMQVNITLLGLYLGQFQGSLEKGMSIKVDLFSIKGDISFRLGLYNSKKRSGQSGLSQ